MKTINDLLNDHKQVTRWPKKPSERVMVLDYLAAKFDLNKKYHELEVNELLKKWHTFSDWSSLRRELVDRGYLSRNTDGTVYRRLLSLTDIFKSYDLTCHRFNASYTDQLVEIVNHAFAYQDTAKGSPRTNKKQIGEYSNKYDMYVFFKQSVMVGCVYTIQKGTSLHFGLLVLSDELQSTGTGKIIIDSVTELADKLGCKSVDLDYLSVAPWLGTYYVKYGFTETGEREEWRGMQMIQMRKEL